MTSARDHSLCGCSSSALMRSTTALTLIAEQQDAIEGQVQSAAGVHGVDQRLRISIGVGHRFPATDLVVIHRS